MIHPIRRLLAPALVLGAAVLATAGTARAQGTLPITVEVRAGAAFPLGEFDDGVGTGWGIGATLRYPLVGGLELYAGYDHFHFPGDEDLNDAVDFGIDDDGLRAGGRYTFAPIGQLSPWLEGGLLVNHTSASVSDSDTSASFDSDWALGLEGSVGFTVPVAPRVAVTSGVRYRMHQAEFDPDDEEGPESFDVNYLAIDFGLRIRL